MGMSYSPLMAIFQELSGQGRVVGGHLSGGTVLSGGSGPFSKSGDLAIQHSSNPFKRHKINAETIIGWEEIEGKEGVAGAIGRAAASVALPGRAGRAVGAGVGAAANSGHAVRLDWTGGKESIITLPEKQFLVLSVLLKDLQIVTESAGKPRTDPAPEAPRTTERLIDLASSVFNKGKRESNPADRAPAQDVTEQIAKLASLHSQGILTDAEFADKKAELLKRL